MNNGFRWALSALGSLAVSASTLIVAAPAQAEMSEWSTTSGLNLLAELTVKSEEGAAYDRDYFRHWTDEDGDCQDTRQEVLIEESLTAVQYSWDGCSVVAGEWFSHYDGQTWTAPSDVDIDHFVPLQEAWYSGASGWNASDRQRFANDLGLDSSLIAMTDNVNQSKGASDPAEWLPPVTDKYCEYASEWVRVKYRWRLSVDPMERSALQNLLSGSCESLSVTVPALAMEREDSEDSSQIVLWKNPYDGTIYKVVNGVRTPITFQEWRDSFGFRTPLPTNTDFVKYPWSGTIYAVTFWGQEESSWEWVAVTFNQWRAAGFPKARNAGWIAGSYFYKWGTSNEIFVLGPDGVNHKLTGAEWARSGYRPYVNRSNEGLLKLSWAPEIAWMTNLASGAGRPMGYAEWQKEASPAPKVVKRIKGDQFYRNYGSNTIWYAGPGMNRPVSFGEWQRAGSPTPTVRNVPTPRPQKPGQPGKPGNPGNAVNCSDFRTQREAQAWFDKYYPYYGDVAGLDRDGDGRACETLP